MVLNRTKYSLFNALSAVLLTLVNGLLGIVVTRLVIERFGSDFNGLNSTANQITNVLLILEGGFTLASNVAMFQPISQKDYIVSNGVLRATRRQFRKISGVFFALGIIVACIYSFMANTSLSRDFVFSIIIMAIIPQSFNLFFATTFRVLLQAEQKEFIISGFTALTIGLSHICNIYLIIHGCSMWVVRFVTMCFSLVNSILIVLYTKRANRFIDFSYDARPDLIKGTKDVLAQKITGVVYSSFPIVFLSVSAGGTMLASVYAVYNNVFILIKSLLHGVIDAPRLGFGQMLNEKKKEDIWPAFKEYEFVSVIFIFVLMVSACALILPFIGIYTRGVTDINYYDPKIAIMMTLIGTIEMLHIPSGHLINMAGYFRISKIFQIFACVLLVSLMLLLGHFYSVYGMLISLLIVAFVLAILEIGYIHLFFFKNKFYEFLFLVIPFLLAGVLCAFIEMKAFKGIDGIFEFIIAGVLDTIINFVFALLIGCFFFNKEFKSICNRILRGTELFRRRTRI